MRYIKLYEQFRLILEANESSKYIRPYPSNQKLDKNKSVIASKKFIAN